MSDEPAWAQLLNYLYTNNGRVTTRTDDEAESEREDPHQLDYLLQRLLDSGKIEVEGIEEMKQVVNHLTTTGLVEREIASSFGRLEMTSKGFDVAHDRQQSRRDRSTNQALVAFTAALVLVNAIPFLPSMKLQLMGVGSIIIAVAYFAYRADVLEGI